MLRHMLKSKIHRATLTGKALDYEGSIAVDEVLLQRADILAGEQVHVLNLHSGARLVTYAIPAPPNSGTVLLNGPAARLGEAGDPVVLLSYAAMSSAKAQTYQPIVIRVDADNRLRSKVPTNGRRKHAR
jgi:aspartate 1-decarboxylase